MMASRIISAQPTGDKTVSEASDLAPLELTPDNAVDADASSLSVAEVKRLAVAGAAIDTVRGFLVRGLAFVGTAILAHLLTPRDFGLVAFGLTLTAFATFLADGGIGTALIRRHE